MTALEVPKDGDVLEFGTVPEAGMYTLEFDPFINTSSAWTPRAVAFRDVAVSPPIGKPTTITLTRPKHARATMAGDRKRPG